MIDHRFSAFKKATNNEAYKMAFHDLWMRRDQSNKEEFIGNTQRRDFLKDLNPLVKELPADSHIFDFGAGAGEIADVCLNKLSSATVHLEEPNQILMEGYCNRLRNHPHLKRGMIFHEKLEDMEVPKELKNTVDLALGLHMIYHFKEKELLKALFKMYEVLKVGGKIFLVYADQETSTTGLAAQYYYESRGILETKNELKSILSARKRLLKDGGVGLAMDNIYPEFKALVTSKSVPSYIFADEVSEIAIMCLTGELGTVDDKPFEMEKLHHCMAFVSEQGPRIGLSLKKNEVAKKDMLRANQPQIITVIEKTGLN